MTRAARRALFAFATWLSLAASAFAQSSPNWNLGYVPTPAEWNFWWSHKMDFNGTGPCLLSGCTLTGPLVTPASTTIGAGLNLPPGVAPTTPNNGDVWTTSAGIFVRINGATVGPLAATTSSSFAATSPILVSFPAGVVTYAFDFTVANTFLAQQTGQGATTTQPGWYAQIAGDTTPRAHLGASSTDVPTLSFGPGNAARDTFLQRAGAANFRLGSADAASPVAQMMSVQNVVAGTSNTAGASRTIAGSQGTGTGQGGAIIFQTAPAGSSGTGQNPLSTALTIQGSGGLTTGAAIDQGAGTLNLAGSLYNNGTAPTGTGGYVRASSPTLVTPALGTPSAIVLTNGTGLPISTGLTGAGTGVLTALSVNVGTAGAFVVNGGALGSPSSVGTMPSFTESGTITGGSHVAITSLGLRDASAAFDVTIAPNSASAALTAGRTLTLDVGNVAHTIQYGTTAGTIIFPNTASDTVLMAAATQTETNKTLNCANNTCLVRIANDVTGLGTGVATAAALGVNTSGGFPTDGAWSTFTPSPSCGTATIATNSARSRLYAKTIHIEIDFTITAIGTCSTNAMSFTLPAVAAQSAGGMAGREVLNSGKGFNCSMVSGTSTALCTRADDSSFAVNDHLVASGVFEIQ